MLRQEWKKLISNKILLAVTIAVIIIPAIYTTLFLGSMWDPYGNAGQLPTAVVNHDKPVVFEGKTLNLGKDLMEELGKGITPWIFVFRQTKMLKKVFEMEDIIWLLPYRKTFLKARPL